MKPLIQNKTTCTQGQLPFFTKKEDYGVALHFTSIADILGSTTKLEWRQWRLTKEFSTTLSEYGKLPESRTKKILKTMKQNENLKRQVEKLTRHNEHLQHDKNANQNIISLQKERLAVQEGIIQVRKTMLRNAKSGKLNKPRKWKTAEDVQVLEYVLENGVQNLPQIQDQLP